MDQGKKEGLHPQKVAVVGSGMTGLVSAYCLQNFNRGNYAVEVFEMGDKPALDSHCLSTEDGMIDVPMRVFNGPYYQNFIALLRHLNVRFQPQKFIYTFGNDQDKDDKPYFVLYSNLHNVLLRGFPSGITNSISYLIRMILVFIVYVYFKLACALFPPHTATIPTIGKVKTESVADYFRRIHLPTFFVRDYFKPLFSAVATCSHDDLMRFPANHIIDYLQITHGHQHLIVSDGISAVCKALVENVPIFYGRKVTSVRHNSPGSGLRRLVVHWQDKEGKSHSQDFDHVVFAIPPSVIAGLYTALAPLMNRIPCCKAPVVIHSDTSVLHYDLAEHVSPSQLSEKRPPAISRGGTFNKIRNLLTANEHGRTRFRRPRLIQLKTAPGGATVTESTIVMDRENLFVTGNPIWEPAGQYRRKETVLTRVLHNVDSRELCVEMFSKFRGNAYSRTTWRNGDAGVWVSGGWAWDGMVLLEGCTTSALNVVLGLGARVPFFVDEMVPHM